MAIAPSDSKVAIGGGIPVWQNITASVSLGMLVSNVLSVHMGGIATMKGCSFLAFFLSWLERNLAENKP